MKTGSINIEGVKLAYRQQGRGPATIIFIHGNSSCKDAFTRQFDHFKRPPFSLFGKPNYRIIAFDLPGHGQSSNAVTPETTYTFPGYAQILNQAINRLGIKNYILAGWSLGGNIALEMAGGDLQSPNSAFKGLMIFGAPPVGPGPENVEKAFLPATLESAVGSSQATEEQLAAFVKAAYGTLDPIPDIYYQCAKRTDAIAREVMVSHWFSGIGGHRQIETVAKWQKPICVVHGIQDVFVALDYLKQAPWKNLWQNKIFELPQCGHAPFLEDPDAFNAILENFIRDEL